MMPRKNNCANDEKCPDCYTCVVCTSKGSDKQPCVNCGEEFGFHSIKCKPSDNVGSTKVENYMLVEKKDLEWLIADMQKINERTKRQTKQIKMMQAIQNALVKELEKK